MLKSTHKHKTVRLITMYGNLADFKIYADSMGYDISGYTDEQLTVNLNLASRKLDAKYRQQWIGDRSTTTQTQDFPRANAIGSVSGIKYPSDSVPAQLIEATYELTYQISSGVVRGVVGDKNEASIKRESKSLVSGMNKTVEYVSGLSPEDRENQVYDSLAELWIYDLLRNQSVGGFTTGRCL